MNESLFAFDVRNVQRAEAELQASARTAEYSFSHYQKISRQAANYANDVLMRHSPGNLGLLGG